VENLPGFYAPTTDEGGQYLYCRLRGQLPPEAGRLEDVTYDGQCTLEDAIILYQGCTRASGFEILPRL